MLPMLQDFKYIYSIYTPWLSFTDHWEPSNLTLLQATLLNTKVIYL